jgi:hypothetical protein
MAAWSTPLLYGHGGLTAIALAALAGAITKNLKPAPMGSRPLYVLAAFALVAVGIEFVLTTWYLFAPSYMDHIEASTASIAQYFRQHLPVYPDLDAYTFHGLVYGPLLAEANSLGYCCASGVTGSKLTGWLSGWLGILVLTLALRRGKDKWAWIVASVWVSCVLISFDNSLTEDRGDPLLMLCSAIGIWAGVRLRSLAGPAAIAALAGAAMNLKLHGSAYLLPAMAIWIARNHPHRPAQGTAVVLVSLIALAIGAGLPLTPSNVSLDGYLRYIRLAAHHGLSIEIFGSNLAFLVSMWIPLAFIFVSTRRGTFPIRDLRLLSLSLALCEIVVTIIASKKGAGPLHLVPFIGFHGLLLQELLDRAGSEPNLPRRAALIGLMATLVGYVPPAIAGIRQQLRFELTLPQQNLTLRELLEFSDRYPRGMIGASDTQSYYLTNFRPWLTLAGTRQSDYGALMDLRLSGVSDAPLASALNKCEIPYLYMPESGAPFSMANGYGGELFSDSTRAAFTLRYSLVESGRFFKVYRCSLPTAHQ